MKEREYKSPISMQGERNLSKDESLCPTHSFPPLHEIMVRKFNDSDNETYSNSSNSHDVIGVTSVEPRNLSDQEPSRMDSSFKLIPRNSTSGFGMPSTSSDWVCPLSRKRRAFSISAPASQLSNQGFPLSSSGNEDHSPPSHMTHMVDDLLKINELTLTSPSKHLLNPKSTTNRYQSSVGSTVSSFSRFVNSPNDSIQRDNFDFPFATSDPMAPNKTPCGSTKSSPRCVPIILLSTPTDSTKLHSPSRSCNPKGRPPMHFVSVKCVARDNQEISSPFLSGDFLDTSIDLMRTPDARVSSTFIDLDTPREDRSEGLSSIAASKSETPSRTPLPRITLTPRTPLSANRRKKDGLPLFPLPPNEESPYVVEDVNDAVGLMMDDLLLGFTEQQATSMNNSAFEVKDEAMTYDPDSSFNQVCNTGQEKSYHPSHFSFMDTNVTDLDVTVKSKTNALPESIKSERTIDLFSTEKSYPTLAFDRTVDQDDDSLSDSDDEGFILTCPLPLDICHRNISYGAPEGRRAKNRRRCGRDVELVGFCSLGSMASSRLSDTSLFGMDIAQEETFSQSATPRMTTPSSDPSLAEKRKCGSVGCLNLRDGENASYPTIPRTQSRSEHMPYCSLIHGKSELSLGSLGLCLEESTGSEFGRDLITPPSFMQQTISPPPFLKRAS